jgi:myo-inositol-1(or 4)-monophosphatase
MTAAQEQALLAVAHEAALAAAAELMPRFGRRADGVRAKSTPTDLVSDADLAAEAAIRRVLAKRRPDDAILAEETGASGSSGGVLRWVVDPLDGTINYLFRIPLFCVSVACEDADGVVAGVVLAPAASGEVFAATRSGPVTLDGSALPAVPRAGSLDQALVATGFGYDAAFRARQAEVVARVLPKARDIRRLGSAALDLCFTAAGRFDAYYERGLQRWDLAAGSLLAARAGLEVRELPATEAEPSGLIAAPRQWIDELHELVAPA